MDVIKVDYQAWVDLIGDQLNDVLGKEYHCALPVPNRVIEALHELVHKRGEVKSANNQIEQINEMLLTLGHIDPAETVSKVRVIFKMLAEKSEQIENIHEILNDHDHPSRGREIPDRVLEVVNQVQSLKNRLKGSENDLSLSMDGYRQCHEEADKRVQLKEQELDTLRARNALLEGKIKGLSSALGVIAAAMIGEETENGR
jgi:uncharacterized coiled-coil DUF342 family protein